MPTSSTLVRLSAGFTLALVLGASAHAQEAAGPKVVRGVPASLPEAQAKAAAPAQVLEVAAGEDLWLIDREAGRFAACRLLKTSQVGERVIRCYGDRLPVRFRD